MSAKIKICHMSSVHNRYDTRVLLKECRTLAENGFETWLVVADGKHDEIKFGVNIVSVRKVSNRFVRMVKTTFQFYKKCLQLKADIYHFHDSELVLFGLILKKKGFTVIYDVHEDVPRDILSKDYIPAFLRRILSRVIEIIENKASQKFDAVIAATPWISKRFKTQNSNTVVINNFPIIKELQADKSWEQRKKEICYVGDITENRGLSYLIDAIETLDVKINLAGRYHPVDYRDYLKSKKGWKNVRELGLINRKQVSDVFSKSRIGIVTFLPEPNHIHAQPNKMFEYMSASLPIIASNFPLWREIIEGLHCGICVDPKDVNEIREAIIKILNDNNLALTMSGNGRAAVLGEYNWESESKKLISFYNKILK